ncbi:hypothetical protein J4H89_23215 (plasmid) [Ralstonia solanacearum]|nr:hypothetical protein J4H89_23215 [Ralstonia solanacearum]
MIRTSALLVVIPLLAVGCGEKPESPHAAADTKQTISAAQAAGKQGEKSPQSLTAPAPKPGDVLEAIYQKNSQGQSTVAIANGSQATYWYGYAFDLNGKRYFTGFAYDTPDKFSEQEKDVPPAPDAKVTLTEATFEWGASGSKPGWNRVASERSIGEFGSYEKADAIDEKEAAQSTATADGRIVLAVPTWYLASGVRIKSFSMFVYRRTTSSSDPDDTDWTYVGNVFRGDDNRASCDADGSGSQMPCAAGSGTIAFVPAPGAELPRLRVAMKGTGIDDAGHKKTYGAADVIEYWFNPKAKAYEAVKR